MKKTTWAKLALLTTAFLWGTSLTVVKTAATAFPPHLLLTARFTLAALLLWAIFFRRLRQVRLSDVKTGLLIGLFLFLAYSSQTLGITLADPGRSGFLSASYCVIVPFLFWLVEHRRPDRSHMAAALVCTAGIFCVSMSGGSGTLFPATPDQLTGDALALLSGFLFACHIVAVTKLGKGRDPIVMTILQFLGAALFSLLATLLFEDPTAVVLPSLRPVWEVLYLAVLCTALSLLLQNMGQKYCDPGTAAILLGFESIFGVIFPVMLGIEHLTAASVTGFVLIFAAILIAETKPSFRKKPSRLHLFQRA